MKNYTVWYEEMPDRRKAQTGLVRMTPREGLSHQMKEWRRSEGLSQARLAAKAGTSQRVISLLETGKYNQSLELLERLAKAMDLRLEVALRPQPLDTTRKQ